ncbi:hypothetical protein HDF14_004567 [Edaphobacter lichenicola]|uniref:Uncharacterized protein n=1 Tax=Tunturiibacter gelidiferens TaxID=3069689 RepID=A0A9X0QIN8_9BACT|nr:hypothetical protein [Edaphobacter lichenicola]
MGIHLNARFGIRDEIGERVKTEFHSCVAFCSAFERTNIRMLGVAVRSS